MKPADVPHPADCPLCVTAVTADLHPQGAAHVDTYNEEQLQAAVADAVAALKSELDSLKAQRQTDESAAHIAELAAKLEKAQTDLDHAVLKASAAEAAHAELVAWLEAEGAKAAEVAAAEARKAERRAAIEAVADFPVEHLDANMDRFSLMSEEAFTAALEDLKVVAPKRAAATEAGPARTPLAAAREPETSTLLTEVRSVLQSRFNA